MRVNSRRDDDVFIIRHLFVLRSFSTVLSFAWENDHVAFMSDSGKDAADNK